MEMKVPAANLEVVKQNMSRCDKADVTVNYK